MKDKFMNFLRSNDLEGLIQIPKSDLHNHATRGGNIRAIRNHCDTLPKRDFCDLDAMQNWYEEHVKPYCIGKIGFENRIRAAFKQAVDDGITALSMSFGIGDSLFYNHDMNAYINAIEHIRKDVAPFIAFQPEISFTRTDNIKPIEDQFERVLELNYFKSIDLFGNDRKPVDNFKSIYKRAKENGFTLKAHVGEFGDAESVRRAVDVLELDHVQHGIAAAQSKSVMKWLEKNQIQLNICPSSNIMLQRVESYKKHPIAELFYNGIPVTINSDDMIIFDQSVSQDYLNLYNHGNLSAEDLNKIRKIGLNSCSGY